MTSWAQATTEPDERPQLLFVLSPTSGPCRRVESYLAQVLQGRHNHDTFDIVRIDADRRPDILTELGVERVPALVVVDGGHVQGRLVGSCGCRQIADLLRPWLR